ncbi:AbrB/MazE/SpoVT family DNA-binding domain-containing protein [Candidatus Woesearchaeota archaeon]|nr:AbrB/MazE/SpoVT family DNA-binding domain-containing protein [Candidatus Woesearchaeota archaeon]
MTEIEVVTRHIGGSLGVIIPREVVKQEGIKPGELIRIDVKKPHTVNDFFGAATWAKSTEAMMREVKKGWK